MHLRMVTKIQKDIFLKTTVCFTSEEGFKKKTLFFCFWLTLLKNRPVEGFIQHDHYCFHVSADVQSFSDSKIICESMNATLYAPIEDIPQYLLVVYLRTLNIKDQPGYPPKNHLRVNSNKSKLMKFRKSGRLAIADKFFLDTHPLLITNCYKYLGIPLQTSLTFTKVIEDKKRKAYINISTLTAGTETDMVKLYDLTSLCNDIGDEPGRNPYTGPVANLLFKMAKVLSKEIHKKMSNSKKASVYALFNDCLFLLDKEKHPKNVASLKYFMADLFMPQASESSSEDESSDDSTEPEPEPIFTENSENTKENVTIESSPFIEMSKLSRPNYVNRKTKIRTSLPQLLKSEDWVKRCKESIKYIFETRDCNMCEQMRLMTRVVMSQHISVQISIGQTGLNCTLSRKQSEEYSEEAIPKPSIPIILPYESLKDTSNVSTSLKPEIHEQLDSNAKKIDFQHSSNEMPVSTFVAEYKEDVEKGKLHLIMFLKASHCYQFLGDEALSENNVGQAWKYAKLSGVRQSGTEFGSVETLIRLGRCRNIWYKKTHNDVLHLLHLFSFHFQHRCGWCKYGGNQMKRTLEVILLQNIYQKPPRSSEFSFLHDVPTTFDYVKILGNSSKCLELAIELPCDFPKNIDIPKNLGNVLNLLGVYYMKETIALFTNENVEKIKEMSEKSQTSFNSAIKAFEKTTDNQYLILIYGNFAKLKRSLAHYHTADLEEKPSSRQIGQIEMQFFKQAIKLYERSLELLQSRKSENCSIWDSLSWDLSTTLFALCLSLAGQPSYKKVEQETIRLMIQSLARCNIEGVEPSLPSKQRQAVINHRLGALYHCILRSLDSQSDNKKSNRTAAETHYIRAGELFLEINQPQDYIQVVLEHLGLLESYLKDLTSFQKKYITLEKMINMILQTSVVISDIKEFSKEDLKKNKNQDKGFPQAAKESTVSEKHVNFLVNQLMDSLKNMCKLIKTPREAVLVSFINILLYSILIITGFYFKCYSSGNKVTYPHSVKLK
ncbi:Erythroid differentiation-related factor 1 [Nymphon striatum]|nr:Erythroid differentiation-related factor 1 [Nymphon striatum]